MKKNSSNSSIGSEIGNTNQSQIPPAKHWVFTLNNHTEQEINDLKKIDSSIVPIIIFQEELSDSGTPHLQGCLSFASKGRPFNITKNKRIHWEKKGKFSTLIEMRKYCFKADSRIEGGTLYCRGFVIPKPIKIISKLKPWQKAIEELIIEEPNDRTIYWFHEQVGGCGKSIFAKYLCIKYNAIMVSGKGADMKYGLMAFNEKRGYYPEIVIIDIPRSVNDYVSYSGIEEVKNGCFFSSKYESGMAIFNCPHIVCFSNELPDLAKMSADRWDIREIGATGEFC